MCVYETGLLILIAYITLLLLPLSSFLGVGAPSLSLRGFMFKAVRCGSLSLSLSLFVVASTACVHETGLLLVCICRTSAASVEPPPQGSCAVAFPQWFQVLIALAARRGSLLLLHQALAACVLSFCFIRANSNSMNSIRRTLPSISCMPCSFIFWLHGAPLCPTCRNLAKTRLEMLLHTKQTRPELHAAAGSREHRHP